MTYLKRKKSTHDFDISRSEHVGGELEILRAAELKHVT